MMRNGKTLACVLSALTFSLPALARMAEAPVNPYNGIVERNAFDVHPAPPAVPHNPLDDRPPPPNLRLQGITDILGRKQVLFKVQLPPKPGMPAKEESFILTEGERQGEIEVLEINPKLGTVKVSNYGMITNLSLEMNSDKLIHTAPVTAPPMMGAPPMPGAIPPPPTLPALPGGKFPRTLRLPGAPGAQSNPGTQSNPGQASGGNNYGYGPYGANPSQQQTPQMDADRQSLVLAAQKAQSQNSKNALEKAMGPIIPLPPALQREFDQSHPAQPPQLPQ